MDNSKIFKYGRKIGLGAVLALVLVVPASADTSTTEVYEMPMPIPDLPSVVDPLTIDSIPSLSRAALPQVSGLPSQMGLIDAASSASDAVMSRVEGRLSSSLTSVNQRVSQSRALVNNVRSRVGSPLSDVQMVSDTGTEYTAFSMASDMANSMGFAVAYLRGLSKMGAVGIDLTFVLIGLAWIAVVNLIDVLFRISVLFFKILGNVIGFVKQTIDLLVNVVNALANIVDILIPFV